MPDWPDDLAPHLPTGTVTFLFSDIEGSTKLLQRLGERYGEVLADHQQLLRQAWADHHGREIDTQGDSFFVVFARATDALAAAAQAQRALTQHTWPAGEHVRVRMGLHTGTGTLSHDHSHYVGLDVHRAARIAAAGHGGQVLLSQATRDQVAKELVAGAGLRDLGKHRLKDLPQREEIYQLVLPGMPTEYPPLKTLDAWPGLRADLMAVVFFSAVLLAVVGLLLPLLVPVFPRVIGLGATGLVGLILLTSLLARPVRRVLVSQWRDARKPFAAVTSSLLSLVVVLATLFVTRPVIFLKPPRLGYDFSYTYHAPTHTGGAVVVGVRNPMVTLDPDGLSSPAAPPFPLWQGCIIQLPDQTLGLKGWKPDQCTKVPTVVNGGESIDGRTTTFHIDPRAVWSDGVSLSADDFLFAVRLLQDPTLIPFSGANPPWRLTALDSHTVRIQWAAPTADYLLWLALLMPVPLHVYATGTFAGVYDPRTGAYNSALAHQIVASPAFNTTIPVDNAPFTVKSFSLHQQVVLVRNKRFFSNFFHAPALDQITVVGYSKALAAQLAQGKSVPFSVRDEALIAGYRSGAFTLVDSLETSNLKQLRDLPKAQVVTVPIPSFLILGFNQQGVAPNARANGGVSIFTNRTVRQAFTEAFDRCAAVRALLGVVTCNDPNLFTDELVNVSFPDYDPTFHLPGFNPAGAAALLDKEGYRVVNGVRRYKDGTTPMRLRVVLSNGASIAPTLAAAMVRDWSRHLDVDASVTVDPDFFAGARNGTRSLGNYDVLMFFNNTAPDPVDYLTGQFGPFDAQDIPSPQDPFGGNMLGIIDPYVQQQDQLGAKVIDAGQRAAVYQALDRYFAQQYYMEVVVTQANAALVKPTLCNWKESPLAGDSLWNSADWYIASSCPS
jgi:ABC-type transport system substrate-binding protein/class 3 adenylate cyclase